MAREHRDRSGGRSYLSVRASTPLGPTFHAWRLWPGNSVPTPILQHLPGFTKSFLAALEQVLSVEGGMGTAPRGQERVVRRGPHRDLGRFGPYAWSVPGV